MNKKEFIEELSKLGIKLTTVQEEQLEKYYELLIEWNKKINLTRIEAKEDVYLKHFYDSITLCKAIDLKKNISLCDIGTGAGFPGIVLKIVFPTLSVTLIDSLLKRINFLNTVINELKLNDIVAIHTRGEEFARNNREKYDIVTSRAVANLNILSEICIPLCKIDGYFIPMKANCEEEIKNSKDILNKLEANIIKIIEFSLPKENSHRTLIIIKKDKKTNIKYPRDYKIIKSIINK